jgi:hypothetical protein
VSGGRAGAQLEAVGDRVGRDQRDSGGDRRARERTVRREEGVDAGPRGEERRLGGGVCGEILRGGAPDRRRRLPCRAGEQVPDDGERREDGDEAEGADHDLDIDL